MKQITNLPLPGKPLLEVDTASDALDADSADGVLPDVLDGNNGQPLLVVVNGLHDTADGTALDGGGKDSLALDAEHVEAVADPVDADVGEYDAEADERDDEGDAGVGGISDSALNRCEDGSARDAHNEDTGTAASVAAKVGGSQSEERRVHRGHERKKDDEDGRAGLAVDGADDGVQGDGEGGVDGEEEVGLKDGGQAGGDEAADGEGDKGVRKHLGGGGLAEAGVLSGVVDEEGTAGDLSTDVAELSDEAEDHVVLLVERALADDVAVDIASKLDSGVIGDGAATLHTRALGDLGKLGEEEEDGDGDTEAGDSQVDVLDVGEVVLVGTAEEGLGGDERADEGSNTVPGLAELQTSGGPGRVTNDDSVGVCRDFEGGKTAGDDESAGAETTEGSCGVVGRAEVGGRPEHDGTERVESKTHDDSELVALAPQDLSSDGGEEQVATTEVHDLETGRLELCDAEHILEVLVEDIEKTVGETPEEEERSDQADGEDQLPSSEEAPLNRGSVHGDTATRHIGS